MREYAHDTFRSLSSTTQATTEGRQKTVEILIVEQNSELW